MFWTQLARTKRAKGHGLPAVDSSQTLVKSNEVASQEAKAASVYMG